jgi:hypothetical protein
MIDIAFGIRTRYRDNATNTYQQDIRGLAL